MLFPRYQIVMANAPNSNRVALINNGEPVGLSADRVTEARPVVPSGPAPPVNHVPDCLASWIGVFVEQGNQAVTARILDFPSASIGDVHI